MNHSLHYFLIFENWKKYFICLPPQSDPNAASRNYTSQEEKHQTQNSSRKRCPSVCEVW